MKNIFVSTISLYQKFISPLLHQLLGQKNLCRYEISCSEFAKKSILEKGVLLGFKAALTQFLKCQPLVKKSYANL